MAHHNKAKGERAHEWVSRALVVARVVWALLSAALLATYCILGYSLFFFSLENPVVGGSLLALLIVGPVLCGLTLSRHIRYSTWRLVTIGIALFVAVPAAWEVFYILR